MPPIHGIDERVAVVDAQNERIASSFRLLIFAALLAATQTSDLATGAANFLLVAVAAYGVLAIAGIAVAWWRRFRPALTYILVTLEILLIATMALLFVRTGGMANTMVFGLPVATLTIVVLAHASVRYRPWLIAYAATLHIAALTIGWVLLQSTAQPSGMMQMPMGARSGGMVQFQVLPLLTIVLTTIILFTANRRARAILTEAAGSYVRAARLARFFSAPVASRLAELTDADLRRKSGDRQFVAVVFMDIRGFTRLSERMSATEVGNLLTEFREIVAGEIRTQSGVIDKFIGDAVLAIFGYPDDGQNPAAQALACVRETTSRLEAWSAERNRMGKEPVAVGIGAHYGEAFVGVVGRDEMLEFTVIGDTVNVAERLERQSRTLDAELVVSAVFLDKANQGSAPYGTALHWETLPNWLLVGREQPIDIHYLPLGPSPPD